MTKPKTKRNNRSLRKSLKKNRSRKNRNNKRVEGGEAPSFTNSDAAIYNNIGSTFRIPALGICKGNRRSAVKKAVKHYESLKNSDNKKQMKIDITSCDENGKQNQPQTITYDDMPSIYDEYNKIIDKENEAVKKSWSYKMLSDEEKNDVVEPHKTFVPL